MKQRISKEASTDLEKIWLYTFETWSLEQADRYLNLIMDEMEYLTLNPKSCKDCSLIRKGYYSSKVKSHLIFYRINLETDRLEIIRVLHQQMDIESGLNL